MQSSEPEWTYTPVPRDRPIAMEVRGIDLNRELSQATIEKIKSEVSKHRMLIFKDQGNVSGDRHVEMATWFGPIKCTFRKHPKSPHPDIFRISNDENEGCRDVGRYGWHIDGSFLEAPFDYSLYHMPAVPDLGPTAFIGFKELLESLSPERRAQWDRLWLVGKDRRDEGIIQPLIYRHRVTNKPVVCVHLGMIKAFIWDYQTEHQRITDEEETAELIQQIHNEIVKDNKKLIYTHMWEAGEFIISDNRALGHEATPETQLPVSEVGLRILHRVTVAGAKRPEK